MKKITQLVALAALIALAASCKKDDTTPTSTTPTNNPTTTGPTAASPTPSGGDISGALISIKMSYNKTVTGSPVPVSLVSDIGSAIFYSAPGSSSTVDAGTVSVNTHNLDKASNNTYSKLATTGLTPSSLDFDSGTSDWNVGGSSGVSAFTYSHGGAFPNFTGTMVDEITKANSLSIDLTGNLTGTADSVYVLIAAGNVSVLKSFPASAATIKISGSDLSALPTVSDNTAVFEVCPFKYTVTTIGSKKYVAIKEQAVVKNINIK